MRWLWDYPVWMPVSIKERNRADYSECIASNRKTRVGCLKPAVRQPDPDPDPDCVSERSKVPHNAVRLQCRNWKAGECKWAGNEAKHRCVAIAEIIWQEERHVCIQGQRSNDFLGQSVIDVMRAVLSQGNRAIDAVCFSSYAQWLFDCYLLHVPKRQGRYSTGLANMKSNIRCRHSLPKSKLNVKLYKLYSNNTMARVLKWWPFKVIQGRWFWHQSKAHIYGTSYWSSIVTLVPSCPVSAIAYYSFLTPRATFFSIFHPYSGQNFRVFPVEHIHVVWVFTERISQVNWAWNYSRSVPTLVITIPQPEGQTTCRSNTALCIASHGSLIMCMQT